MVIILFLFALRSVVYFVSWIKFLIPLKGFLHLQSILEEQYRNSANMTILWLIFSHHLFFSPVLNTVGNFGHYRCRILLFNMPEKKGSPKGKKMVMIIDLHGIDFIVTSFLKKLIFRKPTCTENFDGILIPNRLSNLQFWFFFLPTMFLLVYTYWIAKTPRLGKFRRIPNF